MYTILTYIINCCKLKGKKIAQCSTIPRQLRKLNKKVLC